MVESSRNPWLSVPALDYEAHMGPAHANQLASLSRLFLESCHTLRPERVCVLGCATGNGLEHVDPSVTRRLVTIDINKEYLEIVGARLAPLQDILELVHRPVEACEFENGAFDLIFAALFFEYVEPAVVLRRVAPWLSPRGELWVGLQLPSESVSMITSTPYESILALSSLMRLVKPQHLLEAANQAGLRQISESLWPLSRGKQLSVQRYCLNGYSPR